MRNEIKSFAEKMELAMKENDPIKGDSWLSMDILDLHKLLISEYHEYIESDGRSRLGWALINNYYPDVGDIKASMGELVDLANMCMMVYSRLESLGDSISKYHHTE